MALLNKTDNYDLSTGPRFMKEAEDELLENPFDKPGQPYCTVLSSPK